MCNSKKKKKITCKKRKKIIQIIFKHYTLSISHVRKEKNNNKNDI